MPNCSVEKCHSNNRVKHGLQFHRFPKNTDKCEDWIKFCKSPKSLNLNHATICSLHFKKEDYTLKPVLKEGVKPSLYTQCICGKCQRKKYLKHDILLSDGSSEEEEEDNYLSEEKLEQIRQVIHMEKTMDDKVKNLRLEEEIQKRIALEKKLEVEIHRVEALKKSLRDEKRSKLALEVKLNFEKQRFRASELKAKTALEAMKKIFTPLQIQVLKTNQHPHRWDHQSIIKGLGIRAATSKKAYEYLRTTEHFPLPAFATLTHWVQETFAITPNEISQTINILKLKLPYMTDIEKNVVLMFDEMPLNPTLCYDRFEDKIYGQYYTIQVVMVRSITENWSQPLMFCYDQIINHNTITQIICELESIGFLVRALVSDLSQKNYDLWNDLKVSAQLDSYFTNPADENRRIWMFADPSFSLLNLRDHILDYGMSINGSIALHNSYFTSLMEFIEASQYKVCKKLRWNHLQARGQVRSEVWLASQLLSKSVATMIKTHIPELLDGAEFIELIDKAYDIFTSKKKTSDKDERCGFGVHYETQCQVLENVISTINLVRFGDQNNLLPFQEGFLVSARSLKGLFEDLNREKQDCVDHILTSKLTLDGIHELFSKLKEVATTDPPNAVEAKSNFRLLLINGNTNDKMNEDTNNWFITSQILCNIPELVEEVVKSKDPDHDLLYPEIPLKVLDHKYAQLIRDVAINQTVEKTEGFHDNIDVHVYPENIMEQGVVHPSSNFDITQVTYDKKRKSNKNKESLWFQTLTRNSTRGPAKWLGKFKCFEEDFNKFHNTSTDYLSKEPNVTNKLVKILYTKWPKLDNRTLKRYAKLRTLIRLRYLVKNYEQSWVPV